MPSTPIHASPDDHPPLFQSCRHQHQVWSAIIEQSQQEIGQLLSQLRDGLKQTGSQQLNTQITPYYTTLKRLNYHFHRLQLDRVCRDKVCLKTGKKSCSKPRLSLLSTRSIDEQLCSLTDELNQIKHECGLLS